MKHHRPSAQANRPNNIDRKDKRVSPMAARIRKAGYKQDEDGECVICTDPVKECPHAITQILEIISMVRADDIAHGEAV